MPGEEMEVNVTFPENYGAENLAGKAAVFKCTVKAITEKQLPELNDEYADEYTEFDTMEEYREDVKRNLIVKKEERAKTEQEDEAVEKIIASSQIEIPAPMLETQESNMVDEFAQQLQYQGMSLDQYYQYAGSSREKMMEALAPQAEKRIRTRLVLEEIAKEENITATEEEYEAELKKMAEAYGADFDTVKNIFGGKQKDGMMKDIAVQKAITFVLENAVEVEAKKEAAEEE
jgi:trigger factor